jgi:lipopolysaccharide/colanic/teichoic acid biosynthesis glycosyltransferase
MTAIQRTPISEDAVLARHAPLRALPTVVERRYDGRRRHAKRAMDLGLSILVLPIALPLMAIIAITIKVRTRGPVLFRQERIGRDGRPFQMLKFRTMYVGAGERLRTEPELYATYVENDFKVPSTRDPRIIPGGRFLRSTSLDELPQLFNVLSGTMSLVGPRPIVRGELECYGPLASAYLDAKPGITGRWQTDGRSHVRYPERARLDSEYLEEWTLRGDVVILLKTVPRVVRRQGAA